MLRYRTIVNDTILTELMSPHRKKKDSPTKLQVYARNLIGDATKDTSSRASVIVSNALELNNGFIENVDRDLNVLQERDTEFAFFRINNRLFQEQQKIFCINNIPRMLFRHGRRWGKTHLIASMFAKRSLLGAPMLYLHRSYSNAISQMFNPVVDICKKVEIPCTPIISKGVIDFNNGATLTFKGNSNSPEADSLRGFKFGTVVVEEAWFQRNLKYIIESIIEPTQADYKDRLLIYSSSPPRSKNNFAEHIRETVPNFTGNMLDNPTIDHDYYYKVKAERGDSVSFKREFDGEWLLDMDALVYHPIEWDGAVGPVTDVIIGADWGTTDYTSFIAIAYHKVSKKAYVIDEIKFNQVPASEIVERCKAFYDKQVKWAADHGVTKKIFIEADPSHGMLILDLAHGPHKIPIEAAIKTEKEYKITEIDSLMRQGALLIPSGGYCWEECESIVWQRDEMDNIIPELDDDTYHEDITAALRYGMSRVIWEWGGKQK